MADLPVYRGKFGEREATRLLWRAGFGPKPGEAAKLARKHNLANAVRSLTRPTSAEVLKGPAPLDGDGLPPAPFDAWGHDVLWWLDRMVRTNHPLVERMALIWHDWFATGDVGSEQRAIEQIQLFERRWMGPFSDLLLDVTIDPAMLVWLSGLENTRRAPNENYAREMMELFTLGASLRFSRPLSQKSIASSTVTSRASRRKLPRKLASNRSYCSSMRLRPIRPRSAVANQSCQISAMR